jgi:hypothetical protein
VSSHGSRYAFIEPPKKIPRIMGPRGCLRVVLHAEHTTIRGLETLYGVVIKIHMGHSRRFREVSAIYRKAVILYGDFN